MKWSKEMPKQPGCYWTKTKDKDFINDVHFNIFQVRPTRHSSFIFCSFGENDSYTKKDAESWGLLWGDKIEEPRE